MATTWIDDITVSVADHAAIREIKAVRSTTTESLGDRSALLSIAGLLDGQYLDGLLLEIAELVAAAGHMTIGANWIGVNREKDDGEPA